MLQIVSLLVDLGAPGPCLGELSLRLLVQLDVLGLLLLRHVALEDCPVLFQLRLVQHLHRVLVLLLQHLNKGILDFLVDVSDRVGFRTERLRSKLLLARSLFVYGRQVFVVRRSSDRVMGLPPYFFFIS